MVLASVAVLNRHPERPAHERAPGQSAAEQIEGATDRVAPLPRTLDEIACAYPEETQRYDSEDHDAWDLCAQYRAAAAASRAADWGLWQTIIGGGGLLAVFATLIFNIKATNAAAEAARETKRSVDAAMNTERAWLLFDGANLTDYDAPTDSLLDDAPFAPIELRNVGNSPAWIKRVSVRLHRVERGLRGLPEEPDYTFGRVDEFASPIPVLTDKRFYTGAHWESYGWTPAELGELRSGRFLIVLYGLVEYEDVYGRLHKTQFGHVWTEPRNALGGVGHFAGTIGGRGTYARYNYHT